MRRRGLLLLLKQNRNETNTKQNCWCRLDLLGASSVGSAGTPTDPYPPPARLLPSQAGSL